MQQENIDIAEIAKKQRYAALINKIKGNKPLSVAEIKEIEEMAKKKNKKPESVEAKQSSRIDFSRGPGQPPKYDNPEQLQTAINDYFKNGVTKRQVLLGKGDFQRIEEIEVPTITGLCIYLGFESRQSFYDYEERSEFSYTIKKARLFIENTYEELLQVGNTTGAIFALKNFGWTDKQVIEHEGSINNPMADMTPAQRLEALRISLQGSDEKEKTTTKKKKRK
jgi:hypothetical protein